MIVSFPNDQVYDLVLKHRNLERIREGPHVHQRDEAYERTWIERRLKEAPGVKPIREQSEDRRITLW